jgi:hypothetical protein
MSMQVTVRCPGCDASLPFDAGDPPSAIRCGKCQRGTPVRVTPAVQQDQGVDVCPVCEGSDFYIRKDFDPRTGLAFVVAGALISAVFYYFDLDLVAYSILGAAVVVDLLIYGRLKLITVCYRCHAEFRGDYPRTAKGFDLHTADVLEPEWQRKIGKR